MGWRHVRTPSSNSTSAPLDGHGAELERLHSDWKIPGLVPTRQCVFGKTLSLTLLLVAIGLHQCLAVDPPLVCECVCARLYRIVNVKHFGPSKKIECILFFLECYCTLEF